MNGKIPFVVELLYTNIIPGPNPDFWPEYLRDNPTRGHGAWTFYRGLQIGFQLALACTDGN